MAKRKQHDSPASTSGTKRRKASSRKKNHEASRITSIPVEILTKILLHCLFAVPENYYNTLRRLQYVCRRWHEIIKATPSFWSFIDPHLGPIQMISVLASRSRVAPLTIRDTGRRRVPLTDLQQSELCHLMGRWSSVQLRACCHFWRRFRDAYREPLEVLHDLELTEVETREQRQGPLMDGLETPCFPRLTVLRLTYHIPSTAWLLHFLNHCPSLVHLFVNQILYSIHGSIDTSDSPPPAPINLIHLETMDIKHVRTTVCSTLLQKLHTPKCISKVFRIPRRSQPQSVFTDELLASFRDIIAAAPSLELGLDGFTDISVRSEEGTLLVFDLDMHCQSLSTLIEWVVNLIYDMRHLQSLKIDYLLHNERREEDFQKLRQLPQITELRIRVGNSWQIYPQPPIKKTVLTMLEDPRTFPNLVRLSVESSRAGRFRLIDVRNMLKARYAECSDEDGLPKRLEELRITVSRRSSVLEQIEALVGKERFVKLLPNY